MRVFLYFLISLFAAGSAVAQDSYLCITDQVTGFGFDKSNSKWTVKQFKSGDRYLISRSKKENVVWEVKEIGESLPISACPKDFTNAGTLYCDGFSEVRFSKPNLRFLMSYRIGYWSDTLTRNKAEQTNASDLFEEGKNTPNIAIGKCSPL